jgi:orotate phosphoribosyltransferase-like protein
MAGKNWNSKERIFEDIKSKEIQEKARKANEMRLKGNTVKEIAKELSVSVGRVYEYLKS